MALIQVSLKTRLQGQNNKILNNFSVKTIDFPRLEDKYHGFK